MRDSIKINNKKKQMAIFQSLMEVEWHGDRPRNREEIQKDLQKFEKQGKLKIYYPER